MPVRLRKTTAEKRRTERLRSLPPLAIEFSQIMAEVFGERAKSLQANEVKALRERGAAIATQILDDMEQLRWDQGIAPEMRQLLEATRRKMLTDKRIKGLLKDEGVRTPTA